ncbi:hypothetical protein ABZ402_38585 [Streptomyces mirabilis]|uniref:hypothetical protein n=1 Tax=Streptomyces mirabilis TaxID=68239 RepID=UPI0033EC1BB9
MTEFFSKRDQRQGGVDGRTALYQYIYDDVATYVGGVFASDETRRHLFAAAAELVYVAGWMSFDASHHEAARRYFTLAVELAAEAERKPWTSRRPRSSTSGTPWPLLANEPC